MRVTVAVINDRLALNALFGDGKIDADDAALSGSVVKAAISSAFKAFRASPSAIAAKCRKHPLPREF